MFVITFATQEMLIFRNAKTGEIVVGAEDRVEQCHYAAVVTRLEEELDNELTGGWKIVEVCDISNLNVGSATDFRLDGPEICPPILVVHRPTPSSTAFALPYKSCSYHIPHPNPHAHPLSH